MKYVYGKRMQTLKDRLTAGIAALALLANSVGFAAPFIIAPKAFAAAPDPFPSTNAVNKVNDLPYVEAVEQTYNTVKLRFVNPRPQTVWFEYRVDDAPATGTNKFGPCRVGVDPLPSGCAGKRYLEENDYSYSTQSVAGNGEITRTFSALDNIAIRMTFGPERNWDFDWTVFDIGYGVCTYDFQAEKMWEVTWGYGFEDRNGGAPVFTMASNGGLSSLNGGPVPGYMDSGWHWLYVTDNGNYSPRHYEYEFADGTVRTADVTWNEVNGCYIPTILWNINPILVNVDPYFVKDIYKGIGVDIHVDHLTDATAVEVKVDRTNGGPVIKTNKAGGSVLSTLNTGNPASVTAPIVIQQGSYNEAGSSSWNQPIATWTHETVPTQITVTITRNNGPDLVKTIPLINVGTPFATLAEVMPAHPDPTNSHQLNISGDVYRDIALDNCDNLSECKNQRTNEMLEDWEMRLYKEDTGVWQLVQSRTTDSDGVYKFSTQYEAGVYHVCEVLKAGWAQPMQTWSGSGYKVDTANLSGDSTEGPYCTTLNYDDAGDRSSKSHFGNVDAQNPTGAITYTGGNDVSGVRYLTDINELKFSGSFTDNHLLDQTSFVVWKVGPDFTGRSLLCGNWFNTSTTKHLSGNNDSLVDVPVSGTGNCNNPALWTNGNYEIAHRVYDKAGNLLGLNTPTQKFVVDSTAPDMPEHVSPTDNAFINYNDFYFQWTDVADAVEYEFQSSQNSSVDGNGALNSGVWNNKLHGAPDRNNLTASEIHSYGANGTWYWQVRARDAAGNWSAWTSPWKLTIDMVAPAAVTLVFPLDGVPINGTSPVANDWEDVADADYYIYQSYNVDGSGNCNLASIRWTEDYTASQTNSRVLGDGLKYCWRVKAVDEAGNQSAWSELWKTVVDNTAPSVTLNEIITTSDNTPTLGGSVNDPDADILVSIDGAPEVSGTNNGDGTWTYQVTSPLGTGNHTVRVTAVDSAGNTSSPAAEDSFTVNGSVQSFTITPPAQNSAPGGNNQPQVNSSFRSRGNNSAPDESAAVLAAETGTPDRPEQRNNIKAADNSNESSFGAPSAESSNGFAWYWWVIIALAMLSALFLLLGRRSEERN